jgi:hypothetical protein
VGTFIKGLQSYIRREVKAQRPRTITVAFLIARVHEENHIKIKRSEKDGKWKYRCFGLDSKTSHYPVDTR